AVNTMHDSLTPIGGMIPLALILTGEVVFGGVGSGLYTMLAFAIIAIFVYGLASAAAFRPALRCSLQEIPEPVFVSGSLKVDLTLRRVSIENEDVQLTPTEYETLRLLVAHAGKVLTHSLILKQIWGIAYLEQPHVLRVNISNLRRKIEPDPSRPRHVITEPGVGYRLL
ncbi:MAG: winged helix-turn-helix domain-containing protein, partial [Verrucomicrobia bacterium]|nr:winged helix-turn-helix domain-containing protein [Deltaproteobacteria bacterium]